jgi:hypothetical protein
MHVSFICQTHWKKEATFYMFLFVTKNNMGHLPLVKGKKKNIYFFFSLSHKNASWQKNAYFHFSIPFYSIPFFA